jgi:hypothetical protein
MAARVEDRAGQELGDLLFDLQAIGPCLDGLVVDDPACIDVGQACWVKRSRSSSRAVQVESACFMIQPRDRSKRSAI